MAKKLQTTGTSQPGQPMCAHLFTADRKPSFGEKVDITRFQQLMIRNIVVEWKHRADKSDDPFDQFMSLWLAFNGWGMCVTDQNSDRNMIDALSLNSDLSARFSDLVADPKTETAQHANQFSLSWPIFPAKEVNRKAINLIGGSRKEQVQQLLGHGIAPSGPKCWLTHHNRGEAVPLDWQHTLAAIYGVRNNLFHGNKASSSMTNRGIVASASGTLSKFIEDANIF